jgi:ABC-type uncharacterized transport system permease subunit
MTDAQQDHALAVESVAPELADLRIELCPGHISEGCFWKIYFVLLHPKLTKEAADLLSTPQVISVDIMLQLGWQWRMIFILQHTSKCAAFCIRRSKSHRKNNQKKMFTRL